MKRRRRRSGRVATYYPINLFLFIILVISSVFLIFNMLKYNILAFLSLNLVVFAILVLFLIIAVYLLYTRRKNKLLMILMILALLITGTANYSIYKLSLAVNKLNDGAKIETLTMGVYVLRESDISEISQLQSKTLQAPLEYDKENIEDLLENIKVRKSVDFQIDNVDSYAEAYENLLAEKTEAIVLNSKYLGLLEGIDSGYESKIRRIYEYEVSKDVEEEKKEKTSNDGSVFNVYISGIDTYGEISSVSRSDVNIIMNVNTNTKNILLTTTPRDSYVAIAGGGNNQYDKLTHAGIYGVDASVKTLENLYGINMDYHVKINFSTFLKLVDLVGGVEVYNDQAFSARVAKGEYFPQGNLQLDSKRALAFVRERYSLQGGDNDRGKNQQKVIAAIIDKLSQPSNLTKVTDIMKELENSMQTNVPLETVMKLANKQLDSGGGYTVKSQALVTHGAMGLPSYAMPGYRLYMGQVDQESLEKSKQAMQEILKDNR